MQEFTSTLITISPFVIAFGFVIAIAGKFVLRSKKTSNVGIVIMAVGLLMLVVPIIINLMRPVSHVPHLASLTPEPDVNWGTVIFFAAYTIIMIATGAPLFMKVKDEKLSEREESGLKLFRIFWFIGLLILIALLAIVLI